MKTNLALGASILALFSACSSPEPAHVSSTPSGLGLACSSDAECSSGLCIEEARSGGAVSWTAGSCSQSCTAPSTCPEASACVSFSDGSLCLTQCTTDGNCRKGYVCASAVGACLPDCRLGFSCGTSLTCDATTGSCITPIGTQGIGAGCQLNTDCKSGLCTPEQSNGAGKQWAGGYCTAACGTSTSCADGALCLTYTDGSSYCAAACSTSSECRGGYVCSSTAKVCLPDCRQGWSCGDSLTCDAATGNCAGKMLPVGAACTLNLDCASSLCTPAATTSTGSAWTGGYCTAPCNAATACPPAATCIAYADGSSYCAATCSTSTDCRTGYVCAPGAGACLPDCRLGFSCGSALTCNTSTGGCG